MLRLIKSEKARLYQLFNSFVMSITVSTTIIEKIPEESVEFYKPNALSVERLIAEYS